jgi:hypothetical protein
MLRLISPETVLVNTAGWERAPRLMRFKAIPKSERFGVGEGIGRALRALLTPSDARDALGAATATAAGLAKPCPVICLEKPYLQGFAAGYGGAVPSAAPRFVLLLANGGDEPTTPAMCACLARLPSLVGCFCTNCTRQLDPLLFRPLPIGILGILGAEDLVNAARTAALPWVKRDRRLLVAPMSSNSRLRRGYLEVLSRPEYRELVCIVSDRLPLSEFLALMGRHQSVLSPPGKGYDCYRTWQVLGVGSVPLVVRDDAFDYDQFFRNAGAAYIPRPEELSPDVLSQVLGGLKDPVVCAKVLEVEHWRREWEALLD